MTTEQREAIDRLDRFKTIKILYGNTFAIHTEQLKALQEDLDTVLSLIKQKEKQIDLMIEYIDKEDVSETFCNGKTACDENCTSCIKQYFIELAKEKGE